MGTIHFGQIEVKTSSLDKVLFPESGITKGDLIEYYRRIADTMVPHVRERPLSMRRFPNGIGEAGFFQQEAPDYFPKWIDKITVDKEGGKIVHALCNNAATLVYLANQNTITPHVWLSRVDELRKPDQIIFDLDPAGDDFNSVRKAARYVKEILEEHGLASFVMTTGSSGVHVRAPIRRGHDFEEVRGFARRLADDLAGRYPKELTTEQRKKNRHGRIYLDIMRNAYAQNAVPPYAVRAREGAPVATPIDWDELGTVTAQKYTIRNIFRRMSRKEDPWSTMHENASSLNL